MQPWRKKKGLRRSPKFQTVLDPIEREALGDIIAAVVEAIIARAQSAPKDELAEMMDMPSGHKEAPDDPALARLFPDFQREGDEEYDGDRSLLRSLHENDIARAKLQNLQLVSEKVNGGVEISVEESEVQAFVAGLNDARLYLANTDKKVSELISDRDALVEWLAYNQDSLLTAMMED
ncbi:DUF2017 domain-containing protein [Corynebacterium propinquum]|uniref:DUF2017 domain-containing protein n=1 Tax=Corynebacterium propinquum TaxID=43769 RepID=UPI002542A33A|nr:DUF2017 domain-containing protein [Corynebacterium propinquum]MDK4301991.1 DUF2017 domain-containing protein [Corynebacterium propinquum]